MECVKIKKGMLNSRDFKCMFIVIAVICLALIVAGQILAIFMSNQYKQQVLAHDYEIAGYLAEELKQGEISADDIPKVIVSEKNDTCYTSGSNIMQGTGYHEGAKLLYFYDANIIYKKLSVSILIITLLFSFVILGVVYYYFCRKMQKLENASKQIEDFLDGRIDVRLDDDEEESLSRLFHSINCMATSLKAQAVDAQQTREFLKSTVSDISHQLKTPITALKMYNEIINEERMDCAVIEKFTDKSSVALERIETLIQNLLRITRLDVGAVPFEMKEENLMCLFQSVACDFETRAQLEHKRILLNGDTKVTMLCDGEWMHEAISNLIKNALDHTKENDCIKLIWKSTPVVTKIIIEDTGNGIHQEDIHFIFKRFYRSRFSQNTQGIGLGLPLAKSIVEAHNGTITVDSKLGNGSRFTMNFLNLAKL